ncbi:MAG: hypothetical protein HY704_01395 [Gemmatimonadetes bacterium]|nr:hypothetical protein [Gemmatimonadota bacterium]
MSGNPFRIGGSVVGEYFTDRAVEVRRIVHALVEPQAKLLVVGPRRMGKTSAIEMSLGTLHRRRHPALAADFSGATTLADLGTRVLQAATRQLGRTWSGVVGDLVNRLRVGVSLAPDPATGQPTLVLGLEQRRAPVEAQWDTFGAVLDAMDRLAEEKRKTIGIVLDEFQEIHRFGGEDAEWHLRGVIQRHKHLSYVLAGSRESLIVAMIGKNRAFYKLFEVMPFGPMDPEHLGRWMDSRMETHGVAAVGVGRRVVELAGPRTRDVVQLARAAFELGSRKGKVEAADVERALDRVAEEEDVFFGAEWDRLTPLQQNVLRALGAREEQLFAQATRARYALGDTGSVASALELLANKDLVVKTDAGWAFDNPFMGWWVRRNALPDVGVIPL